MSRGSYEHMIEVLRKKPRLKEIYDNIENYTDDDIDKNPIIPSWMKKHFKKVHITNIQESSLENAIKIAHIMTSKSIDRGTPSFNIYAYEGSDTSVGGFDIVTGDLLADIGPNMVKIGNSCVKLDNKMAVLKRCSYLRTVTIHEYGKMVQENVDKKYQLSTPSGRDYSIGGLMSSVKIG